MPFRFPSSIRLVTACVVAVTGAACTPAEPPTPPGEADRRSFAVNFTDEIALPQLADFEARAAALRAATVSGDREESQQAWREAMTAWQGLEVLHLGPAGTPASFIGGLGMRDRIYAWPQVNLCAVDQQILLNEFSEEGWAQTRLPNVIGFAPLEYVLFVETTDNACPSTAAINTDGSWAALGADEIRARRAAYAAVLAEDVVALTAELVSAWTVTGGFADSLRSAGEAGSVFSTAQQALDEIYAALFTLELITKDKKLAIPAGLHVDCPTETCPDQLESRFSRTSKENVIANLQMMRRVFLGVDRAGLDETGFDDLLRERGAEDLAATMTASLDGAIAAVTSFEGSFEDALATEPARVQAVYEAVKAFTDDFKSTFPSALGLRVPDEGAGDND